MNEAIIIFVRHPERGKVKTRLSATIGEDNALKVYTMLLEHTYDLIKAVKYTVYVYYANNVQQDDLWKGEHILKRAQIQGDLGQKMSHAFNEVLALGHWKVVIIGSDCYELNGQIIQDAICILDNHDLVIGPARDGGYYLLGMRTPFKQVFNDITWSTGTVLNETIQQAQQQHYSVYLLPILTDVDTEEDINFKY